MSKLYLVRHGQTFFNQRKIIQGWCDSPLTETGIVQAEAVRAYFEEEGISFDHVYSSTAERACDTAEVLMRGALPYERCKGLREFNFGKLEGCSTDTILPGKGRFGDFLVPFGGEGEQEVMERVSATLTEIMLRPGHESVLAVSHGASIFTFLIRWYDENIVKIDHILGNCTAYKFDFDPMARSFSCIGYFDPAAR